MHMSAGTALQKRLKTGIITASAACNVGLILTDILAELEKPSGRSILNMILTNINQLILGCEIKTTERAVCAFAAGYIIKILEERQICDLSFPI